MENALVEGEAQDHLLSFFDYSANRGSFMAALNDPLGRVVTAKNNPILPFFISLVPYCLTT